MDAEKKLYSTFWVGDRLYGLDVMRVQEVTKLLPCTRVPLAPNHVRGLINLRGQIATAIDLRNLFALKGEGSKTQMNVFCEIKGLLLSLIVDRIGEVMEVEQSLFEIPPETVPGEIRGLMSGVYKVQGDLLSILEIEKISDVIQGLNRVRS